VRILNAEPENYSPKAKAWLEELGVLEEKFLNNKNILDHLDGVEVLIVRLGINVDRNVIEHAPNLKYIVTATTGTDHIDLEYAKTRDIQIICLKDEMEFLKSITSTSELTWGLLLSLMRKLGGAFDHVKFGGWQRDLYKGHSLAGKKLGILGLGRIGNHIAEYGMAFGCEVGAYDPQSTNWKEGIRQFQKPETLLTWCDVLSIHIPLEKQTTNFLDQQMLNNLKKGAVVINTSRAGVWDENAILSMLTSERLAGVATDVLAGELNVRNIPDHPFIQYAQDHHNLLITPHIGGATFESMEQTEIFIVEKLKETLRKNGVLN